MYYILQYICIVIVNFCVAIIKDILLYYQNAPRPLYTHIQFYSGTEDCDKYSTHNKGFVNSEG